MRNILLQKVLPTVFTIGGYSRQSCLWQQEVVFEKGQKYLIRANSGTGKTSLCSFLIGLRKDYEGVIRFDDTDIHCNSINDWVRIRANEIAYLPQELFLFDSLTSWDNVLIKNKLSNCKTEEDLKLYFEMLGISSCINQPVGSMSVGQKQRVAFIRMICQKADFYLLDEPVSHLDNDNNQTMAKLLEHEANNQNAGIIVTSVGNHLDLVYDHIIDL